MIAIREVKIKAPVVLRMKNIRRWKAEIADLKVHSTQCSTPTCLVSHGDKV